MSDDNPFEEDDDVGEFSAFMRGDTPEEDPDAVDFFAYSLTSDEVKPETLWKPWMADKEFILGTVENLASIIDACIASGRYACDLETTGLDNRIKPLGNTAAFRTVDRIAGVGLCPDGIRGYYTPLHHVVEGDSGYEDAPYNVPIDVFDREFTRLIEATDQGKTVAVFHNGKFDQEFLQFNETGKPWGEWDKSSVWEDTLILAYLRNTRARRKNLKQLSETPTDANSESVVGGPGLGMPMIELYQLWNHKKEQKGFRYDFTTRDVTKGPSLWYAGSDVICTWLLCPVLLPHAVETDKDGRSQKTVYNIEKVCVAATRWMERNKIHIDRAKVLELVSLGQQEWFDSIMDVYKEAEKLLHRDVMPEIYKEMRRNFVANDPKNLLRDQLNKADLLTKNLPDPPQVRSGVKMWPAVYDLNSQQQIGTMFDEMNIPGLKKTEKSGQVKTSKDELERIIEETGDKFPFMGKVRRFREVAKALSTYLEPMLLASDPDDDTMRINFNGHKVDTGRYSTPAKESIGDRTKEHIIGWPELNVHSVPSTADPKRPACMNRLRECFASRPCERYYTDAHGNRKRIPKFTVAVDYAGVELRLATNLSLEPKWLTEFFHCSGCDRTFDRSPRVSETATKTPMPPPARCPNCGSDKIGDLHTLTALAIFGQDAQSRPDWKALRGDAKATNFALSYGGGGSAVCRATGVDKNEGNRIKNQFDGTYYGLKNWWTGQHKYAKAHGFVRTAFGRKYPLPDIFSQDHGFKAKAERNSINGPIQGTSADITKTAMALIYKDCKKRGWLDKVQMTITMHDELVFEIDADVLEEAIPVLVNHMVSNAYVLGMNWPVPLTTDVEIGYDWTVPWDLNGMRYGEVRFIGNKKYKDKSKLPEGYQWENLPSWPDDLRPWFKEAQGAPPAAASAPPAPPPAPAVPVAPEGQPGPSAAPEESTPVEAVPVPEQVAPQVMAQSSFAPAPASQFEMRGSAGMVTTAPGADYTFRLQAPLCYKTAFHLASVLKKCLGGGTSKLQLRTAQDLPIPGWDGGTVVLVNPQNFEFLARHYNL